MLRPSLTGDQHAKAAGTDFMPLQVEYKEKYSAFGRFPGGFTKREGKASDYEILTCRLVDRALRPLFPDNYHAEVYVNIILFSADGVDMPDALAGLAASAALAVSDIPFGGPISEVRVARIDGQFVIDPTFEMLERADMDIMVAATYENIMMVEGEMKEVSEQDLLEAMKFAHEAIKVHCKAQMELAEEVGKTVKRFAAPETAGCSEDDGGGIGGRHQELRPLGFGTDAVQAVFDCRHEGDPGDRTDSALRSASAVRTLFETTDSTQNGIPTDEKPSSDGI